MEELFLRRVLLENVGSRLDPTVAKFGLYFKSLSCQVAALLRGFKCDSLFFPCSYFFLHASPQVQSLCFTRLAAPRIRERAFDACYIEAFKKVPPNTAISSTPGYSSPSRTSCYDSGYGIQCSTTGGYYSAPEVYSYVRNAGLRGRQAADCMKRKGYGAIERPICKTAAEREAYKQSRQAPSDQIECVSDAEVERLYPD